MKKPIFTFLILVIFFTYPIYLRGNDKDPGWFPFTLQGNLNLNSPANMGNLVLDSPAGKHGFCEVKDGHFYFEDGTKAKFWGTNLCFSACFPSKEEAKIIANRLAFFGFNAVRLHHMDMFFAPEGILEDTCPTCTDPQDKKTNILSKAQLEKLDYFIYQLKIRGIYVDMNLLVTRLFTKADGIKDARGLDRAAKPVSIFNAKLIELQKQYAKDLLTHYNPYTKLRYCDDPCIALIEMTNENSLFNYWKTDRLNGSMMGLKSNSIPNSYSRELDEKWMSWLKRKYARSYYVTRPIYKMRKFYPKHQIDDIKLFYLELETKYFDEMTSFLKTDCAIKIPITGMGGHIDVEDITAQKSCDFIDTHTYWDHPSFPGRIWDEKNFTISNSSMISDPSLGMVNDILNASPNNKPYTITEWNMCYPNQYAYEAPLIMASLAIKNCWEGMFQFAFKHNLPSPLSFETITNSFDIMENPQQLILISLASVIFLRAKDVTSELKDGVFTINSDVIQAAVGFIKNRQIKLGSLTIEAKENGAIVLVKNNTGCLLVTIGEVKNTGSGWNSYRKFNWGKAPILLENINADIVSDRRLKAYELDVRGSRSKEIKTTVSNGKTYLSTKQSKSPWFELRFK